MFPHPLSWECKDVLVDARASQLFLLRRVHEISVCGGAGSTARIDCTQFSAAYFLCSTNLCWKERISHQWNISVNSTHRCFLLCLLSNCGKQKPTLGFSECGKTKIGEQKKNKNKKKPWISYDPHVHDVIYLQSCIFEYCIKGVLQFW